MLQLGFDQLLGRQILPTGAVANLRRAWERLEVIKTYNNVISVLMLRAYAAWAEGSVETDIETIKSSMNLTPANASTRNK
jgi:hypothetical protein